MAKLRDTGATVSISTSSARNSSDLSPGEYLISSDVDCFVLQGGGTVAATVTCAQLPASPAAMQLTFAADSTRIAAITASGTGTLYIHRIES